MANCVSPIQAVQMPSILTESSDAVLWPVTVATTILKPGGYQRLQQMADSLEAMGVGEFKGIDGGGTE